VPARLLEPTRQTVTPVAERHDPEARRRLSAPALRAFFTLAARWGLNIDEQRALLGWPSRSTLFAWKKGQALHVLYPDDAFADEWPKLRNTNPIFAGRRPLDLMVPGDVEALYAVRRLLDGRRGGWH